MRINAWIAERGLQHVGVAEGLVERYSGGFFLGMAGDGG